MSTCKFFLSVVSIALPLNALALEIVVSQVASSLATCLPHNAQFSKCTLASSVFDFNVNSQIFKQIPRNTNAFLVVNGSFENTYDTIQFELGSNVFTLSGQNPQFSLNFSEVAQLETMQLKSVVPPEIVTLPSNAVANISSIAIKFDDESLKAELQKTYSELNSVQLSKNALSRSRNVLNSLSKTEEALASYQTSVAKLRDFVLKAKNLAKEMAFLQLIALGEISELQTASGNKKISAEEMNAAAKLLSLLQSSTLEEEITACVGENSVDCEKKIFSQYFSVESENLLAQLTKNFSAEEIKLLEAEVLKLEQRESLLKESLVGTCSVLPSEWKVQFLGELNICKT